MAETTLYLAGCSENMPEYQMFAAAHPDITVNTERNLYLSTNELLNAFITGEFPFDTFVMTSSSFDIKQMLSKGYCSPLSSSSLLSTELQKMYEPIQGLLTQDKNIYGVPFHCYVGYYVYSPEAWAEAGLLEQDVPSSFEEYLDFLEAWVERIIDHP
ncbi:MAG: extracellular solute-binding protein, partial [Alistipes sp.]